jgi:hypothetical protein
VSMLFLNETHKVIGRHAAEFEAVFREQWLGALARTGDARLGWYFNHAMGSGPAYQVVTVTAVADGAAWDRYTHRVLAGDLAPLSARLDAYRYEVVGKITTPVYWSALQEVDLEAVPTDGAEHPLSVFMQDTGWPDRSLEEYIELWNHDYWQHMRQIVNFDTLGNLLISVEEHDPSTWPGSYMAKGLEIRDQWESKLLRTAAWSPLF